MKAILFSMILIVTGSTAFGGTKDSGRGRKPFAVCMDPKVVDASYSARFFQESEGLSISLSVPSGEASTDEVTGMCFQQPGAREMMMICHLQQDAHRSYEVRLMSYGSSQLTAVVKIQMESKKLKPVVLPCKN